MSIQKHLSHSIIKMSCWTLKSVQTFGQHQRRSKAKNVNSYFLSFSHSYSWYIWIGFAAIFVFSLQCSLLFEIQNVCQGNIILKTDYISCTLKESFFKCVTLEIIFLSTTVWCFSFCFYIIHFEDLQTWGGHMLFTINYKLKLCFYANLILPYQYLNLI